MIWEEFRTPPKFGCELPGPKGPGFRRPDEWGLFNTLVVLIVALAARYAIFLLIPPAEIFILSILLIHFWNCGDEAL
ncbi:MAG: hypothetical protein KGJ02_02240 [Verrucomicrobiota bacterium]|nr:hypothetical protein [Verrucomicrobiota bacterium]